MNNADTQKHIEDAKNHYQSVRLSTAEKTALKNRLFADMEASARAVPATKQLSPFFFRVPVYAFRTVGVALLVVLLVTTPVAFAAERSLPGELLYTVKTTITEPVAGVFVQHAQKDEYYQTLLVKRASELRVLAKRGQLEEKQLRDAEEALQNTVRDAIASVETSGAPEDEMIQDHHVIVALVDAALEAVVSAPEVATSTAIALMASDAEATTTASSVTDAERDTQDAINAFADTLATLQQEASTALNEHVTDLITAQPEARETVVEALVEDAQTDGIVIDTSTTSTTTIEVQIEASVSEAVVTQVLEAQQTIAKETAEEAIDAFVETIENTSAQTTESTTTP